MQPEQPCSLVLGTRFAARDILLLVISLRAVLLPYICHAGTMSPILLLLLKVPLKGGADESSLCHLLAAHFFQLPGAQNRQMGLQ